MGYANLLEGSFTDQQKLAKYAHEIHHAGERGAKLTRKLLAFSRHIASDEELININVLLLDQQDMLEKALTARIKLVLELSEDLWSVWIDDADFEDAVLNLSINAMHAMEEGGQLIIRTSNEKINRADAYYLHLDEGDYAVLSIIDTGCGMDEKTKAKIFEPFYSTKGDKGTGLGLSQVYGFVERSGGAISVYSKPEEGTRFVLYFPRYHDNKESKKSENVKNVTNYSGKETILIVDDEPGLLFLASETLSNKGYKTFCAKDAKQALEILENESIDLLLSDIIMHGMDGYKLAAIVQDKYPAVKIQLTSGFDGDHRETILDHSLHQKLLNKPYSSQVLLQRIRELFDE